MLIEYVDVDVGGCRFIEICVILDGVICGEITKVDRGYQYTPLGHKQGGKIFDTIIEVQRSLVED